MVRDKRMDGQTDGQTDGRTVGRTDGLTDGRKKRHIEVGAPPKKALSPFYHKKYF